MSMTTQCPACGTKFRVTPQQLQTQRGRVRCGRCATVFDGFRSLASEPERSALDDQLASVDARQIELALQAPSDVPPVAPDSFVPAETPASTVQDASLQPSDAGADAKLPTAEALSTVSERAGVATEPPPSPRVVEPPPLAESAAADKTFSSATAVSAVLNKESEDDESPPPRRRTLLAASVALMFIALVAQAVYALRGDIAAHFPETRPYLHKACETLGCIVALPQRPRSISIEASDLQAVDPANPGVIALTATLRNQASTVLGFPALDVVLTNARDHTVARRIYRPSEYLSAGQDLRAGIAANAEMTIRLTIDSGDLGAAGFRLDLLAAPPS